MIEVTHLTRKYGSLTAVDSISLQIPRGQIVGLLGHNGAGKTTTLKMLTGFLEPTSGDIKINGLSVQEHLRELQKDIGYLSEQSPLYPEMRVWQYLEYVAELRGIPENSRSSAIDEALNATALREKATALISTLSKGYKQRVGVAQAIIHKPSIVVLDEPTNGLDPSQIFSMRSLIKSLAENATVIVSTHILQEVEAVCDRVVIILNGKIAVDSTLADLHKKGGVYLTVDQALSTVQPVLSAVAGVTGIEQTSENQGSLTSFRIATDGDADSLAPEIGRKSHEAGWKLFKLGSEHRNLEAIFKEVNATGGIQNV